jgi:hypothetical protein
LLSALFGYASSKRDAPASRESAPWTEPFLYEYALARYRETDDLIGRGRGSAQSLLTWQTALFVGAVGIAAKGGLLNFGRHEPWVVLLTVGFIAALGASVVLSARAAFWTEPASTPVSPQHLLDDLCGTGIRPRELCKNLISVYESTKRFVGRIQHRLRTSLILTAIGLALFVALLILLSVAHADIIEKMFSSGDQ